MPGFTLAAVASIAAGLSIGAAATVGVTLAAADEYAPVQVVPAQAPVGLNSVEYGGRLPNLPCNSVQSCRGLLPPWLH